MKIVICGSVEFTPRMKKISDELHKKGHETYLPLTAEKIIAGEISLEDFKKEKDTNGDFAFRKRTGEDLIKKHYNLISDCDAILVVNIKKDDQKNHIGANTFLEIGFAHVLGKKIYILNEIPENIYTDEIKAIQPIILHGDLDKII